MSLGQFMQGARESAGLSIDELASRISIRAGLLTEMEKNNFIHCGGDTYARGHLRNIAVHILCPEYRRNVNRLSRSRW
jgi:cytoskeletal protein RodZ